MLKKLLFLSGSLIIFSTVFAQNSQILHAGEILQGLKKLNVTGSVLYIAAHPDDENTRLLAYLSREKKLRTGYLSITRGDGGQNLIGKEQGDLLGLLRTQELLAARRIDGAEQFFTRANDFGFSKNPEETFRIWNRDSILADVVWNIRKFRPDVIITRFPTTGEGGHGHHTASAMLAIEAFDAAADPKRFPEQLKYTGVWKTRRLFWNTFNFGGTNTISPGQIQLNVGVFNPLLGKGYGEIAAESRSMHKSQGFGSARARGAGMESFVQLKGDAVSSGIFEGIDQSWGRIPAAQSIQSLIASATSSFDPSEPAKTVPALAAIYKKLQELDDKDPAIKYWKQVKTEETKNLLLACSGLWLEVISEDITAIPGKAVKLLAQVFLGNNIPVKLNKISWMGQGDTILAANLVQNELYSLRNQEILAGTAKFSNMYWLDKAHGQGMFSVTDQQLIGSPENRASVNAVFSIQIADMNLEIERPVVYKSTDPVKGEIYRALEVLPPATINLSDKAYIFTGPAPKKVRFIVRANTADVSGTVNVKLPPGWKAAIVSNSFSLKNKNEEVVIEAMITPGSSGGKLSASLRINAADYTKSITRIEYDHIPYQFMLSDAEANLERIDMEIPGRSIGYIAGAGDDIPSSLMQIGYAVTTLTDEMLTGSDLSKYDAIVTGVRAYNINERLQIHYVKLMDYVKNGGNLVVQYNTNNRLGPVLAKIGPYPFTISRDRVTDENAHVDMINPAHPVLNYPNKITKEDFKDWIQERGTYFASDLDKNYETVLSMSDQGEKPASGSLIVGKYGKGNFVYAGLVFFRELPAGVPGAYRLFVNILSLPKNK